MGWNRVKLQGSILGGEVWSITPAFAGPPQGYVQDYADLLSWANAVRQLHNGNVLDSDLLALMSQGCSLTTIRVEAYDEHSNLTQAAEVSLATPIVGTGNASKTPQTALVFSMLTGRPGRSYNGRVYFPALGAAIQQDSLRIAPSVVANYAAVWAQQLEDIAAAAPGANQLYPAVASGKLGLAYEVTTVRVGDVLDTQRRRRDAYVENYASAAVVSPG